MSHARTGIRDTVKTALTGLVTTGSNVFGPEKQNFADTELPCLTVFTVSESLGEEGFAPGALQRDLSLIVECRAKATGDIDAILDIIEAEVEVALHSVANLVIDPLESEKDFDRGSEKPVGVIIITYRIQYFTRAGIPGSILFQS